MKTLVLENLHKIVYAAPNLGTTILYWLRSQSKVLSPAENSRIQGLSRLLSDIPVLFKANLIFNDFSRKALLIQILFI